MDGHELSHTFYLRIATKIHLPHEACQLSMRHVILRFLLILTDFMFLGLFLSALNDNWQTTTLKKAVDWNRLSVGMAVNLISLNSLTHEYQLRAIKMLDLLCWAETYLSRLSIKKDNILVNLNGVLHNISLLPTRQCRF